MNRETIRILILSFAVPIVSGSAGEPETPASDETMEKLVKTVKAAGHSNLQIRANQLPEVPSIPAGKLAKVQGRWLVVRHFAEGMGIGTKDGSGEPLGPEFVFSGRNVTYTPGRNARKHDVTRYAIQRVDVFTNPKQIDVAYEEGGDRLVQKGIYLMDQNFIHCEFAQPGEPRPKGFQRASEGEENQSNFLILRRAKQTENPAQSSNPSTEQFTGVGSKSSVQQSRWQVGSDLDVQAIFSAIFRPAVGGGNGFPSRTIASIHSSTIAQSSE